MAEETRKKILFVLPSLTGGGSERRFFYLSQYLDREKYILYLVLFEKKGEYLGRIPRDIVIYDLNKRKRLDFFKLIFLLAYKIYPEVNPCVVVSFLEYANIIAVIARKISFIKPPIIIFDGVYRSVHQSYEKFRRVKQLLVKKIYPQADKVICVCQAVKEDLSKSFGVPDEKIKVIYNGVDMVAIEYLCQEPTDEVSWFRESIAVIVSCGRLTRQKDYSLLLEAFAKVQKDYPVRLLILGEGEEKAFLENLTCELDIKEKVRFLGYQINPYKYMAKADIFVLSSLWEGFATVIIEAFASQVAVIATRCPSGVEEIITDGVNGLLVGVGDSDILASAIGKLLTDAGLRKKLAFAGKKRAEDFRLEKTIAGHQAITDEITRSKNGC